jgi:hypothetical protein
LGLDSNGSDHSTYGPSALLLVLCNMPGQDACQLREKESKKEKEKKRKGTILM